MSRRTHAYITLILFRCNFMDGFSDYPKQMQTEQSNDGEATPRPQHQCYVSNCPQTSSHNIDTPMLFVGGLSCTVEKRVLQKLFRGVDVVMRDGDSSAKITMPSVDDARRVYSELDKFLLVDHACMLQVRPWLPRCRRGGGGGYQRQRYFPNRSWLPRCRREGGGGYHGRQRYFPNRSWQRK